MCGVIWVSTQTVWSVVQARKPYTITKQREKWSDEEHRMFLEGMKLYGRSWARVAAHVQTKSTVQIRSHAQKYFNRLKRVQGAPALPSTMNQLQMTSLA
jgi:SHAQKYF class myb-like DNA-binding protein